LLPEQSEAARLGNAPYTDIIWATGRKRLDLNLSNGQLISRRMFECSGHAVNLFGNRQEFHIAPVLSHNLYADGHAFFGIAIGIITTGLPVRLNMVV